MEAKTGRKIFQEAGNLFVWGGEAEVYLAQASLNSQYKVLISYFESSGFWQKASEPSQLRVLC
jgi:hypothetical protein